MKKYQNINNQKWTPVRQYRLRYSLALLLVLNVFCANPAHTTYNNKSSGDDSLPTSSNSASSAEEITLSSCTTEVDTTAPVFFKSYFKCVTVASGASSSVITTKDLPPHKSYYYGTDHPNYTAFDTTRGSEYSPNPNTIAEQSVQIEIPVNPTAKGLTITTSLIDGVVGTSSEEYPHGPAGVALDGVLLFNPLAAPGDDIEEEKYTFDNYNSHPTENNTYHYHTYSPGPLEVLAGLNLTTNTKPGEAEIELFGIMCDGTVVMGCTELDGSTPNDADFDPQNGHVHDLKDGSGQVIFSSRYHTHICPSLFPNYHYTPEIQYYKDCKVE